MAVNTRQKQGLGQPPLRSRCVPGLREQQQLPFRAGSACTQGDLSASPRLQPLAVLARARARPPAAPTLPPGTARPHASGAQRQGRPQRAQLRPAASAPQRWEGAAAEHGPQVPVAGGTVPTPQPAPPSRPPLRHPVLPALGPCRSEVPSTWPAERGAVGTYRSCPRRYEADRQTAETPRLAPPPEHEELQPRRRRRAASTLAPPGPRSAPLAPRPSARHGVCAAALRWRDSRRCEGGACA
ncbi:hypothetical protein HispidOSU_016007 [Sigmodon hispidus]